MVRRLLLQGGARGRWVEPSVQTSGVSLSTRGNFHVDRTQSGLAAGDGTANRKSSRRCVLENIIRLVGHDGTPTTMYGVRRCCSGADVPTGPLVDTGRLLGDDRNPDAVPDRPGLHLAAGSESC